MNVACVSEGETEYICVPKILGRLGHVIVSNVNAHGCAQDWDQTFEKIILPYVKTAALKNPDKILVVVDRERRPQCCGGLAAQALRILTVGLQAENLASNISIVVSDRKFECIVMADYELVDKLPILSRPVSQDFGLSLDGSDPKLVVDQALKPGSKYHKLRHGGALASRMRLEDLVVQSRSRCLRKLLKEVPPVPQELE